MRESAGRQFSDPNSPYTTGLPVGGQRFLFIDDTFIEDTCRVRRNFHQARRLVDHPLIVPDIPTDQVNVTIYGTVLRDLRDESFHMWYHSQRFTKNGQVYRICYARSSDGLAWDKPDVGTIEIDGSTAHNVVAQSDPIEYSPGINVIHCPDDADPAKRFRRIFQRPSGTCIAYSPDGIHWDETEGVAFRGSDAASVFYDLYGKRYIATSIDCPRIGPFLRRTPVLATSADFLNWSDFRAAFQCDDRDDALVVERLEKRRAVLSYGIPEHFHEEINNMFCFNYADVVIGMPVMFDCCGYDEWKGTPGGPGSGRDDAVTHVQLAWCRDPDLEAWQRTPDREPFLAIAEPPRWDCGFHAFAEAPVRVGDELWFYYSGEDRSQQHPMFTRSEGWRYEQGQLQGGISVAALRLDGFASLDADRQGGVVTTRAFLFDGGGIAVNAVSYHGMTVDVLDAGGEILPGFSADNCVPILGDSVAHQLRFQTADISTLKGRRIRLRFHMSGAMLFAFIVDSHTYSHELT